MQQKAWHALPEQKQRRKQLRGQLESLEKTREKVSPATFEQLLGKYQGELTGLEQEIVQITGEAELELGDLAVRQSSLEEQAAGIQGSLEELETLSISGAIDQASYKEQKRTHETNLNSTNREIRKLGIQKDELQQYLSAEEPLPRKVMVGSVDVGQALSETGSGARGLFAGVTRKAGGLKNRSLGILKRPVVKRRQRTRSGTGKPGKSRKLLFVFVGVVVIAVVAIGFFGLPMANSRAEQEVEQQLERFITENHLEDVLSYRDIRANVVSGQVTLEGVRVGDPEDFIMSAGAFTVRVSPLEALRLLRSPETATLAGIQFNVDDFRFGERQSGTQVVVGNMQLNLEGEFSQQHLAAPDTIVFNRIRMETKKMAMEEGETGIAIRLDDYSFEAEGTMSAASFDGGFQRILTDVRKASAEVSGGAITLNEEVRDELRMLLGDERLISNPDNWAIERFKVEMATGSRELEVTTFELASPLVRTEGSAGLQFGKDFEPESMRVFLEVTELREELRVFFSEIVMMMGEELPMSGPFTFEMAVDAAGDPQITITSS